MSARRDEVAATISAALPDPARRVSGVEVEETAQGVLRATVRLRYRDLRGGEHEGSGRLYLPSGVDLQAGGLPLMYFAGYAAREEDAPGHLARGYLFATVDEPAPDATWPGPHPLMRGPGLDLAVLHTMRSLRFVDDGRVAIHGISAGGWLTLLLAGETFPLNAAMPDVPVLNWAYNAAYHRHNRDRAAERYGDAPPTRVSHDFCVVLDVAAQALGDDCTATTWWDLSPLAHLDLVTCPVTTVFSSADMLVPIAQVSPQLVQPTAPGDPYPGYTQDPRDIGDAEVLRRNLLDMLPSERVTVRMLEVPPDAVRLPDPQNPPEERFRRITIPEAATQWSVGVLDEGATNVETQHTKHALRLGRDHILDRQVRRPVEATQLTAAKLDRLMRRHQGEEWHPLLTRLDYAAAERYDVVRGLITYCGTSPDAAARLQQLYAELPAERRALGDGVVEVSPERLPAYLRSLQA